MFHSAVIVLTIVGVVATFTLPLVNKFDHNADKIPAPMIRFKPANKQPVRSPSRPNMPGGLLKVLNKTTESCKLTWNTTQDDSPVDEYVVEKFDSATGEWLEAGITPGNVTEMEVTGLKKGHNYKFRVKAKNKFGSSSYLETNGSTQIPFTTPNKPGGPLKVLNKTTESCKLTWNTTQDDSPVDEYVVEKFDLATGEWLAAGNTPGNMTEMEVTGLKNGHNYKFRVKAKNKLGSSSYLETNGSTQIPFIKPGKPEGPLKVIRFNENGCTLKWKKPKDDHGTVVEKYLVEKMEFKNGDWYSAGWTFGNVTEMEVDGLIPRHKYMFRVMAKSKEGESEALYTIRRIKIPSIPDKPEGLEVSKIHEDGFTLKWMRPRIYGGRQIKHYLLEKFNDETGNWDNVGSTTGLSVLDKKVDGLIPGNEYNFRVMAVNALGASEPLEMKGTAKIPTKPGKPEGPFNVSYHIQSGCMLTWKKPKNDGGKPIKTYLVEKLDTETGKWVSAGRTIGNLTEKKVDGLMQGHKYKFRVRAVNEVGESEPLEIPQPEKKELYWFHEVVDIWDLKLEVWKLLTIVAVILVFSYVFSE